MIFIGSLEVEILLHQTQLRLQVAVFLQETGNLVFVGLNPQPLQVLALQGGYSWSLEIGESWFCWSFPEIIDSFISLVFKRGYRVLPQESIQKVQDYFLAKLIAAI